MEQVITGQIDRMKIPLAILSILTAGPLCFGQITNIDGLFGIKLGEPLPASCTNSATFFDTPDQWGFQNVFAITPPRTNSEFDSDHYLVTLTPSNHLVCEIDGAANDDPNSVAFDAIRDVLRKRYGNENASQSFTNAEDNLTGLIWPFNHRSLNLTHANAVSTLTCQDDVLSSHPAPVTETDTNGL
jgi:hypothetical protein